MWGYSLWLIIILTKILVFFQKEPTKISYFLSMMPDSYFLSMMPGSYWVLCYSNVNVNFLKCDSLSIAARLFRYGSFSYFTVQWSSLDIFILWDGPCGYFYPLGWFLWISSQGSYSYFTVPWSPVDIFTLWDSSCGYFCPLLALVTS